MGWDKLGEFKFSYEEFFETIRFVTPAASANRKPAFCSCRSDFPPAQGSAISAAKSPDFDQNWLVLGANRGLFAARAGWPAAVAAPAPENFSRELKTKMLFRARGCLAR